MKTELNIAVFQMTSSNNLESNIQQFWDLVKKIKHPKKLDLISTPENTFFMRHKQSEKQQTLTMKHKIFEDLVEYAQRNEVYIHIGSVALREKNHDYNATVVVTPEGQIFSPYQKIHLFDIQLEGEKAINESDSFRHGDKPALVEYEGWKMGMSICYDLRFSELYSHYAKADAIFIPSAFLVPTGKAHWEVLIRARAIENQCYVIAAAQGGKHGDRSTYGHSMIVDPWGEVIGEITSSTEPAVLECTLDKSRVAAVRKQIPMHDHRRL